MMRIPNGLFFSWVEYEMSEGRSVKFRLKGNSMYPLLRDGLDEIILHPCRKEELRQMDIVLFRYGDRHLLHRIIRIDGDRLYMQGDGCIAAAEECLCSDVVGKVEAVVRPSGREVSMKSKEWRFLSFLWRKSGRFRILYLKLYSRL